MPVKISIERDISEVFFAEGGGGLIRSLSFSELKIYDLLCFLAVKKSQCHVSIGDLENLTGLAWWEQIREALMGLQKRGFIKLISTSLSDDENYQGDTLRIGIGKLS